MIRKLILVGILLGIFSGCAKEDPPKVSANLPINYEIFILDENWTMDNHYKVNSLEKIDENNYRVLLPSGDWVTISGFYIEVVPIQ